MQETMSVTNEAGVGGRIFCGVDGTPESLTAVRQAVRLADDGELVLFAVANLVQAAQAGIAATHAVDLLQRDAEVALEDAKAIAPAAQARLVNGDPATVLLQEAEAGNATLIAVGSHGRRRTLGLLLGTVAAKMLHDAKCSVLVARPAEDPATWPHEIVVGYDGSPESEAALAAARSLAERFGGEARTVQEEGKNAVQALVAAADSADLVAVGSRGLHGLKSLGSVSERVAHEARCSVLVVRSPQAQ
jgi:nucleotide-binding universal stress UspA family protein